MISIKKGLKNKFIYFFVSSTLGEQIQSAHHTPGAYVSYTPKSLLSFSKFTLSNEESEFQSS